VEDGNPKLLRDGQSVPSHEGTLRLPANASIAGELPKRLIAGNADLSIELYSIGSRLSGIELNAPNSTSRLRRIQVDGRQN
jgi:hypothetical protein